VPTLGELGRNNGQRAKQSDVSRATLDPSRMAVDGNVYRFGDYVKVVAKNARSQRRLSFLSLQSCEWVTNEQRRAYSTLVVPLA
jgi:hypothetical protein